MENRDLAFDDSFAEEESLTFPHFDDEATVQSARPVVPLHEVRRASRSKQKMLIVAALCLAAIVGGVAASLIFSDHAQPVEKAASSAIPESSEEASNGFITPSGEASGATVDPNETVAVDTSAATTDSTAEVVKLQSSPPVSRQPPIRNSSGSRPVERPVERVVSRPEPEVEDREADERAARREERREARRLRRERRAGDGLTRIREIFEGSPRP